MQCQIILQESAGERGAHHARRAEGDKPDSPRAHTRAPDGAGAGHRAAARRGSGQRRDATTTDHREGRTSPPPATPRPGPRARNQGQSPNTRASGATRPRRPPTAARGARQGGGATGRGARRGAGRADEPPRKTRSTLPVFWHEKKPAEGGPRSLS